MVLIDFEELAYYSASDWCMEKVYQCFKPIQDNQIEYWSNKFNEDIFLFYLSLDRSNRKIFIDYLMKDMAQYTK